MDGDGSFRASPPTVRVLDNLWRAKKMRSGTKRVPLASGDDGPREAGLKVEMLMRRLVPGERIDLDWGTGRGGGCREIGSCVKFLEVALVTYCYVINHLKILWLKTTNYGFS